MTTSLHKPAVLLKTAGFLFKKAALSKRTVRIFTHQLCQEVDGVVDEIRRRGCGIERVNLCQFPEKQNLLLSKTDFAEIKIAGWMHDFASFSFESKLTGLAREVALKECNAFVDGLLLRQSCQWLNDPRSVHTASNKPFQLQLAANLEIRIPTYVITNDFAAIKHFQREHGAIIIKSLSAAFIQYGQRNLKFYTRRMSRLTNNFKTNLTLSPIIVQKEIHRTHEVRVTVVDDECFAIAFDCRNLPGVVDIRQLDFKAERTRFSSISDLSEIKRLSKKFVRALGLNYAGLDWAVTESGEPILFEANPLASFKWYELVGAGNITTAIATALVARTK